MAELPQMIDGPVMATVGVAFDVTDFDAVAVQP